MRFQQYFRELQWPTVYPAYGQPKADWSNDLWVEEYPVPGRDPPLWTVYDAGGRKIARVTLPRGFPLLEAGTDYVLGIWRDEAGVMLPGNT